MDRDLGVADVQFWSELKAHLALENNNAGIYRICSIRLMLEFVTYT